MRSGLQQLNGPDSGHRRLAFTLDNGVKVFNLIAEPVKQVIVPGRTFDLWGFNGSAPGPTIQANEGIGYASFSITICRNLPAFIGTDSNFPLRWMAFPASDRNR